MVWTIHDHHGCHDCRATLILSSWGKTFRWKHVLEGLDDLVWLPAWLRKETADSESAQVKSSPIPGFGRAGLQAFRRFHVFPQQRKLKGSSAQISSGVFRCGSQEQVPEAGSGRFRRVPVCAGSGVCWYRFRRLVPEGSGEFRCVLV